MTVLANNGVPQLLFTDMAVATQWELNPNPSGNFIINSVGLGGGTEFTLNGSNGNLRIGGDIRAGDFIVTSTRESNYLAGKRPVEPAGQRPTQSPRPDERG